MAIAVDQNYDKAQRKISTANLEQFAGVDCQLLVEKETHRPIIMDGATVGGKFKCASTDELEAVKAKADSATSADSVQWEGVEGVPDNVKNALSFIEQSLTPEQKAQVVQNLEGTFLPLAGGTMGGDIVLSGSSSIKHDNSNSNTTILGANRFENGASISLYGKDDSSLPGVFVLSAKDGTTGKAFVGKADGSLTWNTLNVDVVNAIGGNYIRYENGLQICWGTVIADTAGKDWAFPVPYKDTNYVAFITPRGTSTNVISVCDPTSTTKITVYNSVNYGVSVGVIGLWK